MPMPEGEGFGRPMAVRTGESGSSEQARDAREEVAQGEEALPAARASDNVLHLREALCPRPTLLAEVKTSLSRCSKGPITFPRWEVRSE